MTYYNTKYENEKWGGGSIITSRVNNEESIYIFEIVIGAHIVSDC